MSDSKMLIKELNKAFGDIIHKAGKGQIISRIPTDILSLDIAMGGGFPRGRVSIVYGPESSLKTTIVLKAIAQEQIINPKKTCVFVDLEGHYDPLWGAKLGVDNNKLYVAKVDHAEQAVDAVETLLYAKDISIVAIDSIAALVTANELERSADVAVVGGSGLVVGKLYRKSSMALSKAQREGRNPTLLLINQIRYKIGVMYGNPETMPGGNAFKFASSMTMRVSGKDENDKKVHPTLPCYKLCSGTINKWKVPITAKNFEFKMATIDISSKGLTVGQTNDWGTLFKYMKEFDFLVKTKKGWALQNVEFKNQNEIRNTLIENTKYYMELRERVIKLAGVVS